MQLLEACAGVHKSQVPGQHGD